MLHLLYLNVGLLKRNSAEADSPSSPNVLAPSLKGYLISGVSVGSFHRNMELLGVGEPVRARATPEDPVWLFQLFSAESLLMCRTGRMINVPGYLCSSRAVFGRGRWIESGAGFYVITSDC